MGVLSNSMMSEVIGTVECSVREPALGGETPRCPSDVQGCDRTHRVTRLDFQEVLQGSTSRLGALLPAPGMRCCGRGLPVGLEPGALVRDQ